MECDVTTAVRFKDLHSTSYEILGLRQNVFLFRVSSERNDWRMFEQQKNISDASFFAEFDQTLLKLQRSGEIESAEMEDGDHFAIEMFKLSLDSA